MTSLPAPLDDAEPILDKVERQRERLPDYARLLAAYHQACCVELREMLEALPIEPGEHWLDLACGDGVYTSWLSQRVGESGRVIAIDIMRDWLNLARESVEERTSQRPALLCESNAETLPLADGSIDGVWCAQSLYSLPNAATAVREMARVLRPGGVLALLENDTLHHVLLPWPVEMEIEVRLAELQSFVQESQQPRKFYVGRRLAPLLTECGLEHVRLKPWANVHQHPLAPAERTFLTEYLLNLRQRVAPRLRAEMLAALDPLVQPDSQAFLLDQPDAVILSLDLLVWGIKPGCSMTSPRRDVTGETR